MAQHGEGVPLAVRRGGADGIAGGRGSGLATLPTGGGHVAASWLVIPGRSEGQP